MTDPRQLSLFDEPAPTTVPEEQRRETAAQEVLHEQTTLEKPADADAPEPAALTSYGRCELSDLRARLAPLLGAEPLGQLILTNNRSRILSSKKNADGEIDVRIHRCFTTAEGDALEAAAAFISGRARGAARKRMLAILRRHFAERPASPHPEPPKRRLILRPAGHVYDLHQLRDALNREYFGGSLDVHITWSRARKRRKRPRGRFSIRLGSYNDADRVIRIHPFLDRPFVPRYVVESVVYHELLHAALPAQSCNGRRRLHTPEFRRRERRYRFFSRAEKWLEANLERLVLGY